MAQPAPTRFAQRLRGRRVELGLSQKEVARRIGIGQDVLSRIERGEYVGSDDTVKAVAAALDLNADELLQLAGHARDPVVVAIVKSDRLSDEARQSLLGLFEQLIYDIGPPASSPTSATTPGVALVTLAAAAAMLSVSEPTLLRLVAHGELDLVHVNRLPRITSRSLAAFLERTGGNGA